MPKGLFFGIFLLCVENFQHFFQRHAVACLHQQGIARLYPVQQSIRCLAVVVGMEGLDPLGRSHHSRALCVFAVGHKAVQITLRSQTAQLLVGFAGQLAQLQHIAQRLQGNSLNMASAAFMLSGFAL